MSSVKKSSIRMLSVFITLIIILSCFSLTTNASVSLPDKEVNLYFLDEELESKIGSIPSSYKTSYTIKPTTSSSKGFSYYAYDGSWYVNVSDKGVVTPKKSTVNYITSSGVKPVSKYSEGTAVIRVTNLDDYSYTDIKINTKNYSTVYCDDIVSKIAKDIKANYSTDEERVVAITKYVAENYDYSAGYSSGYSMILYGAGDCWASTSLIIMVAEKMGYTAWSRNGNKDPGAGSGHMNALVKIPNGKIYECEAGFSGTKPRYYSCYERTTEWSYSYTMDGGISLYQYDGYEVPENLVIPSEINGNKVVSIGKSLIHSDKIKSITIPDTVTSIGDFAFTQCTNLKSLNIPASVTSIGNGIVADCTSLTSLTVDSANPNYKSVDNVIYSKDGKTLIMAPIASSITIPSSVTEIAPYAFYYNKKIKSINVPSTVKTIGEGAFGNATSLSSVTLNEGLEKIGGFAFAYNGGNIYSIVFPSTLKSISDTMLYGSYVKKVAFLSETAPEIYKDQNDGKLIVNSTTEAYIKTSAKGYEGDAWCNDNIKYIKSNNPAADAKVTPSPTSTTTTVPTTVPGGSTTTTPSGTPTKTPTSVPTTAPTTKPTVVPTTKPTTAPTAKPTTAPSSSSSEKGVAAFVERLYTVALGRASDVNGKADWVDRVTKKGYTGAQLAEGFLYSPEFLGKSTSDSEFLDVLYATFFNRPADEAGKNGWLNLLASGTSRQKVIEGFIDSIEFANLCLDYGIASGSKAQPNKSKTASAEIYAFVDRLYDKCLGRAGDANGRNGWASDLANMRKSGSVVAYGFFFSEEFVNKNVSNEEYVTLLYRVFMDREPDAAGFNDWVGKLNAGASRKSVFDGFTGSQEWIGICASYGILK